MVAACRHPSTTSDTEGFETSSSVSSSRRLFGTELAECRLRCSLEYFPVWTVCRRFVWTVQTIELPLTNRRSGAATQPSRAGDSRDFETLSSTYWSCPAIYFVGARFPELSSDQINGVVSLVIYHVFVYCAGWWLLIIAQCLTCIYCSDIVVGW